MRGSSLPSRLRRFAASATLATGAAALPIWLSAGPLPIPQQPTFRSGVELVLIDVSVIDPSSDPVEGLGPEDFAVTVDRVPRRIASVEFIRHVAGAAAPSAPGSTPAAGRNRVGDATAARARDVLIVLDDESLDPGQRMIAKKAAGALIDRLGPADRVGVVTIPRPAGTFRLTTNRADARKALAAVGAGTASPEPAGMFWIGLSEAFAIERRDALVVQAVADRECRLLALKRPKCEAEVVREALQKAAAAHELSRQTLEALRRLGVGLRQIDGPKTMVLVSAGLVAADSSAAYSELEAVLAAAQVTLYTLHLNKTLSDAAVGRPWPSVAEDRRLEGAGLEHVTAAAGGTLLEVAGTVEPYFDRVATELSASYLLGVEVWPGDRDGKPHQVAVTVKRPGLRVRSRKQYVIAPEKAEERRADGRVTAGVVEPSTRRASPLASARQFELTPADLEPVLARASAYVAAYEGQISGMVAEERYEQTAWSWRTREDRAGWGEWVRGGKRTLRSDYLLVKTPDSATWIPFRDVFEVDGQQLRDRDDRLKKLFLEPSATALDGANEVIRESARYNLGGDVVARNVNLPTLPLSFFEAANRARFVFKKLGEETLEGVRAWQVGYAEKVSPTLVRGAGGDNPAEGVFWIEPEGGRILKSTLRLTGTEITVAYRPSQELEGFWALAEMKETYTSGSAKIECVARYTNFRRFQVSTEFVIKRP